MIDGILGIDLGTSSVKLIYSDGGRTVKAREGYDSISPDGWWRAICRAARSLDLGKVRAVGLSSQVGTYVTDSGECISWNEPVGKEELDRILLKITREEFVREISMPHPRIVSYPLPRLTYIKNKFPRAVSVCMPKDLLCLRLTGNRVSDLFSWRGLADLKKGVYSRFCLESAGLGGIELPKLISPFDMAGKVNAEASAETGIPIGTPVYVGCNDFFSGLLGMGICENGDMFDITGTSEHIGLVREDIPDDDGGLVCGPYFCQNVHYGVTASSGSSFDFAGGLHDLRAVNAYEALKKSPPVFLPYLCGERAPIWDGDARGVFFGIEKGCTGEELAYSVTEGVAFSIYHIYECMGKPTARTVITAGGAGKDPMLNKMKASLFGIPIKVSTESDCSALGAVICAAVGCRAYPDLKAAISDNCGYSETVEPDPVLGERLNERYGVYKRIYPAIKDEFKLLKGIKK